MTLALVGLVIFVGMALTEAHYASQHPYRYGPARVIEVGAIGGAVMAFAVGLLAIATTRPQRGPRSPLDGSGAPHFSGYEAGVTTHASQTDD